MITSIEKEYLHPQIGFKEIVANALDFGATNIGIDFKVFDHQPIGAIIINDDGRGPIPSDVVRDEAALPTLDSFLDVIDLGHSVNLRDDITKIGGFGLGLKKGLLGIGRNILLATHNEEWVFFLLLSAELNEKLDRDGESMSQIPYLCYNKRTQEWSQSEGCVSYSYGFAAFNEYTAFPDDGGRAELLREALKHLPGIGGGLMILIHNLKPTIDCASVARDIKMAMIECEWDGSLRNYLGLFLNRHKHLGRASHVSIKLKGTPIKPYTYSDQLYQVKKRSYSPRDGNFKAEIYIGINGVTDNKPDIDPSKPQGGCISLGGMMIRAFKPFVKRADMKNYPGSKAHRIKSNKDGIVCSAEITINKGYTPEMCGLTPTVDKTDFHDTEALKGLIAKMNTEVKIYADAVANSIRPAGSSSFVPAPSKKRKRPTIPKPNANATSVPKRLERVQPSAAPAASTVPAEASAASARVSRATARGSVSQEQEQQGTRRTRNSSREPPLVATLVTEIDGDEPADHEEVVSSVVVPTEAAGEAAGEAAPVPAGTIFGPVHELFTVDQRDDVEMEALTAILSYLARGRIQYVLTDTAAMARAEFERSGCNVWPRDYLRRDSRRTTAAATVVQREPLVLRAASLLTPTNPEVAPFLNSIFGNTVIVPTADDMHTYRATLTNAPEIVALDGAILSSDGAFGGQVRAATRLADLNMHFVEGP